MSQIPSPGIADASGTATRPVVLLTGWMPPEIVARLGEVQVIVPDAGGGLMSRNEVLAQCGTAIAIINQAELRVDAELLDAAPNLRVVANVARGYDNLDLAAMSVRGVWAANNPDAFSAPTAEVAFGLLLMVARRLGAGERLVRAGAWQAFAPGAWDGTSLVGKTLGIIGLGNIGREMARRAEAFGIETIYHQRTKGAADSKWVPLSGLLQRSDFVSLHVPATPETRHLINATTLGQMKPGAILINTARGAVVDEDALVTALKSGRLAGAGLDVFADEPRVHPWLMASDRVALTPHLGGGTVESRRLARITAVENVVAVLSGRVPPHALRAIS